MKANQNELYDGFLKALSDGNVALATNYAGRLSKFLFNVYNGDDSGIPDKLKARKLSARVLSEMFSQVETVLLWADSDLNDD